MRRRMWRLVCPRSLAAVSRLMLIMFYLFGFRAFITLLYVIKKLIVLIYCGVQDDFCWALGRVT